MPKINVYLSRRSRGGSQRRQCAGVRCVPSGAVRRARARRTNPNGHRGAQGPRGSAVLLRQIGEGIRKRMTPRLVAALKWARGGRRRPGSDAVSSLDLLHALLDDGENLAVRLLLAQGVDIDALAEATRGDGPPNPALPPPIRMARSSGGSRCEGGSRASALETVVELGHN